MRRRIIRRKRSPKLRPGRLFVGFFSIALFSLFFLTLWAPTQRDPFPWISLSQSQTMAGMLDHTPVPGTIALMPLPAAEEDIALRAKMEQVIRQFPETLNPHVYFYDVDTHRYVNIGGDDPVPAASVIKLPMLAYYLQLVDKGEFSLEGPMVYEAFHQAEGSGVLQYEPFGQKIPSREVARKMIQISDNTCTNILLYYMGGLDPVNEVFQDWGLGGTTVSNWLPDIPGTNLVTMKDMATVLYNIDQGPMLSVESRQVAMDILEHVHNRSLLREPIPDEVRVAHKTGNIGISVGDSGLFILPDGKRYILAVQVERPYNNSQAIDMIRALSKLAYEEASAEQVLVSQE